MFCGVFLVVLCCVFIVWCQMKLLYMVEWSPMSFDADIRVKWRRRKLNCLPTFPLGP